MKMTTFKRTTSVPIELRNAVPHIPHTAEIRVVAPSGGRVNVRLDSLGGSGIEWTVQYGAFPTGITDNQVWAWLGQHLGFWKESNRKAPIVIPLPPLREHAGPLCSENGCWFDGKKS